MQQTITLSDQQPNFEKMKKAYESCFGKTPPYAEFKAQKNGVTITAYQSGKVVFQGKEAQLEAEKWGVISNPIKKTNHSTSTLPKDFSDWPVIGSDEVGNGSYLGPLVVCAAYVEPKKMPLLRELGVKDSKMLTDTMIKDIAKDLVHIIPYQKLVLNPKKYNEIQPMYNATHMKVALHNQAIYLLLKKINPVQPKGILIDQFTPEGNYRKYLKAEANPITKPLYFTTKGEQYHLAVAAASILCRAEFLNSLDAGSKELGITLPSGAGKASDVAAAKILQRGGLSLLSQYAKLHFANTEKAKKIIF